MATIQIKKKSLYTWEHIDSELGMFILSKFYFSADGTKFQVVEQGQAKRRIYDITDIEVFDIAGGAETFANITQLSLRLEELKYPAYNLGGVFTFDPNNYDLDEFTNTSGDPFVRQSEVVGGASPKYATLTSSQLATQDVDGFVDYANELNPNLVIASDEFYDFIVTDTGQIFKLYLSGVTIGLGQTAISATDVKEIRPANLESLFKGDRLEHQATGSGVTSFGILAAPTAVGTTTNTTASFAVHYTDSPRTTWNRRISNSAAVAGSSSEFYNGMRFSSVGLGFYAYQKVAFDTSTNGRFFVGVDSNTVATGNVDPSTLTNIIAFGKDSTDTHVHLIHNNNAGIATKQDLGLSFNIFGATASDQAKDFAVEIWNFYGSSDVFVQITNLKNQSIFFKKITSDLPDINTALSYRIWANTGTDTSASSCVFSNIKLTRQS